MNSIFSNLKRKSRSRSKAGLVSPKAKPLDILPGLAETEEESRPSTSSTASTSSLSPGTYLSPSYSGKRGTSGGYTFDVSARNSRSLDVNERKRDSRRVVLTGAEGLTFEDFFPITIDPPRPAPLPPTAKPASAGFRNPFRDESQSTDSPLNSIDFRFSGLNIQFDVPSSPCTARTSSPTPSVASSRTTSTTASTSSTVSGGAIFTPPTSDDESSAKPFVQSNLARAPTCKSQRASVYYLKPPSHAHQIVHKPEPKSQAVVEDETDSDDVSWFAEELSDIVTLFPQPCDSSSFSAASKTADSRARPDSVFPTPRSMVGRARSSKSLPSAPQLSIQVAPPRGPSCQLDPSFPQQKRRRAPSRPPPPPPIRIEPPGSPTMEEKTDELLALLANAALDSYFLGTGLGCSAMPLPPSVPVTPSSAFAVVTPIPSRPPPRMSVPADINGFFDDDCLPDGRDLLPDELEEDIEFDLDSLPSPEWPPTPKNTRSTPVTLSIDSIPLEPETPRFNGVFDCMTYGEHTPLSPAMPDSPVAGMYASDACPRVLRSRWSSSTLSSLVDTHQPPVSPSPWKLRLNIGSTSPSKKMKTKPSRPSLRLNTPFSLAVHTSVVLDRRDSMSSSPLNREESDGNSASSGLRRKPIPVEIFMRS